MTPTTTPVAALKIANSNYMKCIDISLGISHHTNINQLPNISLTNLDPQDHTLFWAIYLGNTTVVLNNVIGQGREQG